MQVLSRICAAAALLIFALVSPAFAQKSGGDDISGAWDLHGCWDGGSGCNWTETFDFAADGTFQAQGYEDRGTWSSANGQMSMTLSNGNHAVYSGAWRNNMASGTMRTETGATGTFSLQRSGGAAAEAAQLLRGAWHGSATWDTGVSEVYMVFNADGSFHVQDEKAGNWGEGVWQLSGSQITIRYHNNDQTVFVGTLQGDTISGTTSDAHGYSGTFTMSR